eukprot:15454813-Alexandrium_andersonii.AAC.1
MHSGQSANHGQATRRVSFKQKTKATVEQGEEEEDDDDDGGDTALDTPHPKSKIHRKMPNRVDSSFFSDSD